jgi:hypothetical protein
VNVLLNAKLGISLLVPILRWAPFYSALKMEAVCSSETLVSTYESTRCCNTEDQHRHRHRRENFQSHITFVSLAVL